MSSLPEKKIFLVISSDLAKREAITKLIQKHVSSVTVYEAADGATGLQKLKNVLPHVIVTDVELAKINGIQLINAIIVDEDCGQVAIVVTSQLPEKELFVDELVTGKLQFVDQFSDEAAFNHCLVSALNFSFHGNDAQYRLRFLAKGDVLLREGEKADSVFIVKTGRLRAYRIVDGKDVMLGTVELGEFVGEMAYINGEPRSANVHALTDCELIEISVGTLDRVLYRRPAWSKTLMLNLSKRLKQANAGKAPVV